MKKGQAWSVDAIVGVFLFIVIMTGVLFFTFTRGSEDKAANLDEEGEKVYEHLAGETRNTPIENKQVDPKEILQLNYTEIKQKLGLKDDFCIYFVDEKGNLIYLNESGAVTGKGSPKVVINGISCTP